MSTNAQTTNQQPPEKFGRRMINFLGLRKSMVAVLLMVILVGMGEKMAERFLPLYIIALGGTTIVVGLLNGMDNLLSALYSFPGGYLSDRLGHKRALLVFNLIALFGFLIVIIIPTWPAVIIGSIFFISWTAISLPAVMSLVSDVLPTNKRTMGVTLHSFVRRIPMALGPVVGGTLIGIYGTSVGVRLAFIAAFAMGVVALITQQFMIKEPKNKAKSDAAVINPFKSFKLVTPDLRNLLISDILVRFCEQIPYAFVVIWAVTNNGITPLQFGLLTTIEMVTAMLIYIPVAYLADRNTKKPFVLITFGFFSIFPLILIFSHSFPMLVIAFIIRGLKEFGEPTRKALIMDLAPEDKKALTFGVYYLIRDVIVSIAAFGGAFLWNISPQVNYLTAFAFGLIGMAFFAIFGRDMKSANGLA
ncbi:MAG: MFS transporter [Anaerolineaceae bacterium]